MRIKTLELNHFRSARHLKIELDANLNVFVGVNGVGKTTVLDASASMLSWAVARLQASDLDGSNIREIDILNSKFYSHMSMVCEVVDGNGQEVGVEWRIVQTRRGRNPKEKPGDAPIAPELRPLDYWADVIRDNIGATNAEYNLPLFVYYPVNRAVLDIPLKIRTPHQFDLLEAYDDALSGGANFRHFFEWYRDREDLENENRSDQDTFAPDRQLDVVRNAIRAFLPGISTISVKRNPLRMEIYKDGEKLRVDQMSDGEKCLFAMIGDLARRLAIANPVLDNPLEGTGVVLIDEIDLHLHPQWQRMVIPQLRETFPNCQFLVTTHSPHVVTHVKPDDSLFLLSRGTWGLECVRATEFYGKSAERVLEDLMGLSTTRPTEVAQRLTDIYLDISQTHLEDAKKKILSLRDDIGEDSELMKADVLIKRKEIIGK